MNIVAINDGLELDEVLQRVLDGARALTGARYGVLTTLDGAGGIEDFLSSGLSPEQAQQLWEMPGGPELFEYINSITDPWRVADFAGHVRALGRPEFRPPTPTTAFLTAPIRYRSQQVGNIHMGMGTPGREFSREDAETLAMFAAPAALAIANARQYRDERQARAALETLVETSPVGVVVFDVRTGAPASFNREALRIVAGLVEADQSPADLLGLLTVRRADGREFSLTEFPLAEVLSASETVRTEEVTLSFADGRSVAALVDQARNNFLSGGSRNNLEIDRAPNLPPVSADRQRIVQGIGNLLSNAARHSPEESPIRLAAAREEDQVAISVADAGRGIPAGQLPGLGARFTFTLPTAVEAAAPGGGGRGRPGPETGQPVLVVDDGPQTLRQVRNILSEAGYRPIVTAEPQEALRLAAQARPSPILLDMMLPGADGIELIRDLSAVSRAPVVFLSAYGGDQVIAQAFETGADDYIVKPFSSTELVARVGVALRRLAGPHWIEPAEPYARDGFTVNYAQRRATLSGQPVQLTTKEHDLLRVLSINAGRTLTHEQVLQQVWESGKGDMRGLRSLLLRLRHKLG